MLERSRVFCIDPGSKHAGWALMDLLHDKNGTFCDIDPIASGTCAPKDMLDIFPLYLSPALHVFIIEGVEVHRDENGNPVAGKDLFETLKWIGRYIERSMDYIRGRVPYWEPKRSTVLRSILAGETFTGSRKTAARRVIKERHPEAMKHVTSHAQEAVALGVWYGLKGGVGKGKTKVRGRGDKLMRMLYGEVER